MAPTADWDTLEPTAGTPGNSYEAGLDIKIGAAWINVPDITGLNPAFAAKTRDRATYAAKGKARPNTYARDVVLSFNVEEVRDDTGHFQDELNYLLGKAGMLNQDNQIEARFFDVEGAEWAWGGTFAVEHGRANTGDNDAGMFSFTLTSIGGATPISNPVNDAIVPGIATAEPSGAAAASEVLLTGVDFTGATGAHVGTDAATIGTVYDDRHATIIMPAGSAGVTYITITTPDGTSAQLPYTRGA